MTAKPLSQHALRQLTEEAICFGTDWANRYLRQLASEGQITFADAQLVMRRAWRTEIV